jgi:hypothetical protein
LSIVHDDGDHSPWWYPFQRATNIRFRGQFACPVNFHIEHALWNQLAEVWTEFNVTDNLICELTICDSISWNTAAFPE